MKEMLNSIEQARIDDRPLTDEERQFLMLASREAEQTRKLFNIHESVEEVIKRSPDEEAPTTKKLRELQEEIARLTKERDALK